jgi:eukaryotic-like serine/threonine-protein kinase
MRCEHCNQDHSQSQVFCPHTGKLVSPERFLPDGTVLDQKYRVGKPIGVGGMGAVFEATHVLLAKKVAIKLLLPQHASNEEMSARLLREAKAASVTGHRNIVAVLDMGRTEDGGVFLVMEHIKGRSLDHLLKEDAPIEISRAARMMSGVLLGLEAVHRKGIIHRDLKPSNLMLTIDDENEELVKILDFGISKNIEQLDTTNLTTEGRVLGTPRFMSPEQARGATVDARTDVYAVGAILYSLIAGVPPLTATNYNAMIAAILDGRIKPPSSHVRSIPHAMDQIVMRSLAQRPDHRFPDATSFRKALQPFCAELLNMTTPGVGPARAGIFDLSSPAVFDHIELSPVGAELSAAEAPTIMANKASPPAMATAAYASPGPAVTRPSMWRTADRSRDEPEIEAAPPAAPPERKPAAPAERKPPAALPERKSPARVQLPPLSTVTQTGTVSPEAFEPQKPDDAPLELDIDPIAAPVVPAFVPARPVMEVRTLYRPPSTSSLNLGRALRVVAVVAVAGAAAGAGWLYRDTIRGWFSDAAPSTSTDTTVLVLIETEPKDAEVLVDGVRAMTKPISLPKSDRVFTIHVQARGYVSQVVEVKATKTRSIRVRLKRPARN